jgi:hypothetical protein
MCSDGKGQVSYPDRPALDVCGVGSLTQLGLGIATWVWRLRMTSAAMTC